MKKSELRQMIQEELNKETLDEASGPQDNFLNGLHAAAHLIDDRVQGFMSSFEEFHSSGKYRAEIVQIRGLVKGVRRDLENAIRLVNRMK